MEDTQTLYELIHDYIEQNPMNTGDIVGLLETIKLEYAIRAIKEVESGEDLEEE